MTDLYGSFTPRKRCGQLMLSRCPSPARDDLDDLFDRAHAAEQVGDIAEAERLYRLLMKSDPTDASAAATSFLKLKNGRLDPGKMLVRGSKPSCTHPSADRQKPRGGFGPADHHHRRSEIAASDAVREARRGLLLSISSYAYGVMPRSAGTDGQKAAPMSNLETAVHRQFHLRLHRSAHASPRSIIRSNPSRGARSARCRRVAG